MRARVNRVADRVMADGVRSDRPAEGASEEHGRRAANLASGHGSAALSAGRDAGMAMNELKERRSWG